MLEISGDNFFTNRFDWFSWNANLYEGMDEIREEFEHLHVFEKPIANIRAIGAGFFKSDNPRKHPPYHEIKQAGIPCCCELDKTVWLHEPIILEFQDNTSLEILPQYGFAWRIGQSTIPKHIKDGQNHSNFDFCDGILSRMKGQRIMRFWSEEKYSQTTKNLIESRNCFFELSNGLVIKIGHLITEGFGLSFFQDGKIQPAFTPNVAINQILLSPSGLFTFVSECHLDAPDRYDEFIECSIHVDIDHCYQYFMKELLIEYCDKSIQDDEYSLCNDYEYGSTDYSYDDMRSIIFVLQKEIELLKSDSKTRFDENYHDMLDEMNKWSKKHITSDNLLEWADFKIILADYLERLCQFLEGLMRVTHPTNRMCLYGP